MDSDSAGPEILRFCIANKLLGDPEAAVHRPRVEYSPYEIVCGRPPPIIKQVSTNLPQVRGNRISQQMDLGKVINRGTKFVQEKGAVPPWGTAS